MWICRIVPFLVAGAVLSGADPSLEKEAALGKHLAEDFRRQTTPIDSPILQSYLDRLGQKIGTQLPSARFPFTFRVIADDLCRDHEPTVLPGGYVFVPAGLFVAAHEEEEVAGMLAHAMQHSAQRHGSQQATPERSGTIPLIFMGSLRGCNSQGPVAFRASQRSAELEADVLAVQTVAHAGFDPNALVRYVERAPVGPEGPTGAIPSRDERITALLAAIQKLPKASYAVAPTQEFMAAQQEARRLMEKPVRLKAPPTLMH